VGNIGYFDKENFILLIFRECSYWFWTPFFFLWWNHILSSDWICFSFVGKPENFFFQFSKNADFWKNGTSFFAKIFFKSDSAQNLKLLRNKNKIGAGRFLPFLPYWRAEFKLFARFPLSYKFLYKIGPFSQPKCLPVVNRVWHPGCPHRLYFDFCKRLIWSISYIGY
jgi:hypothetical protein